MQPGKITQTSTSGDPRLPVPLCVVSQRAVRWPALHLHATYYWRGHEGNQLPYIDEIQVEIVADEQTRILNCSQGKYDTAFRICGPNEIPFWRTQSAVAITSSRTT